ncbi:MAG: Rrf2 family transcriptional regulator [bacterium]
MAQILKISEAANLGFHAMLMMAEDPDRRVTTRDIAERFEVSEFHLSKILQRLKSAGLLKSVRGPQGGFTLNRSPSEITLLEVFENIEGHLEPTKCLLNSPLCGRKECIFGGLLLNVNREIADYLKETRLSDLVSSGKKRKAGKR